MKKVKISIATGLILSVGYVGMAFAHTQAGSLGTTTSATTKTDTYTVSCSGGSHHLRIQVKDNKTTPELGTKLTISATKAVGSGAACATPNGPTVSTTDANDADTAYSAWAQCDGGDGDYVMKVVKPAWTANGRETYVSQFHCEMNDVAHTHTVTEVVQTGNQ